MTFKKPPQLLTRFYGNCDYALELIAEKAVTFVHVDKLNDAFDPYFFFETDFQENHLMLLNYVREHHPADVKWFIKEVPLKNWLDAVRELKAKLSQWRTGMYVLSLSGERDGITPKENLYMWGHYGNGHRGIAIEFNSDALADAATKANQNAGGAEINVDSVWAEIKYADKLPPLTTEVLFEFFEAEHEKSAGKSGLPKKTRLDEYYELMGCIKSHYWEKENEWRLMWHNDETRVKIHKCPIDQHAVEAIYLGLNASKQVQDDILFEARRNFKSAKIYKAKKRHGDIAVDFEMLSQAA